MVKVLNRYKAQKDFEYFCEKNGINIISKEYLANVESIIEIPKERYEELCRKNGDDYFRKLQKEIIQNKLIINPE